jgi:superfamily II DNA helicase RecQ
LEKLVKGGAKLMVGAPTGSGKSLTFLFLPTLWMALHPPPNAQPENIPKVIVCMPFKSLLKSTCKAAEAMGFECAFDGEEQLDPKVKRFALATR